MISPLHLYMFIFSIVNLVKHKTRKRLAIVIIWMESFYFCTINCIIIHKSNMIRLHCTVRHDCILQFWNCSLWPLLMVYCLFSFIPMSYFNWNCGCKQLLNVVITLSEIVCCRNYVMKCKMWLIITLVHRFCRIFMRCCCDAEYCYDLWKEMCIYLVM